MGLECFAALARNPQRSSEVGRVKATAVTGNPQFARAHAAQLAAAFEGAPLLAAQKLAVIVFDHPLIPSSMRRGVGAVDPAGAGGGRRDQFAEWLRGGACRGRPGVPQII